MTDGMITVLDALQRFPHGITRQHFPRGFALASRIADLRRKYGRDFIRTIMEPNSNNRGSHARYIRGTA